MSTTTPSDAPQTAEERKKKYKQSLNLPKTSFPMRANLAQNEPQSIKRWAEENLFESVLEARADAPVFAFHDGPPYANGSIHVGHLLNKVLKDVVVRSRLVMGERCHYVPGWDCHGLPIEHKVLSGLVESGKIDKIQNLDEDARRMAIRRECHKSASKFQKLQAEQMQRLLTLADYEHPYMTMAPEYERSVLELFAELLEQGIVYRALKPVYWSIANRTALAEAELEYMDRTDPSIYVDFEATDVAALAAAFGVDAATVAASDGENEHAAAFLIWTTTPWTLASNVLIAVHARARYVLARIAGARGERLHVVAKELLGAVAKAGGAGEGEVKVSAEITVLAEVDGKALLGLEYEHPFCDRRGRIVEAEYVTLEDGTGLVHTAPGHGAEDFETGQREGVEVYCPVRADGTYDDSVPEWLRGLSVWDANPKVIAHLIDSGHLYHHHDFVHSYPHDWRSKTPVIYRATEQWFVGVDQPTKRDGKSLRELALHAAEEEIRFYPSWGKNRLRGMLESRPDWCLSRQRSWGLPIPAFRRADGSVFLTSASVRAVAEAFSGEGAKKEGSDAWFQHSPAELLRTYDPASDPDAPEGLEISELEKMYDIFDVWFESGSSWHAVMRARGIGYPVDLYLEGSDQHRGWFQLSMLPALGATGHAPFKSVLTHGFTVARDGKKMSKSLGNTLEVEDLLKQHGADVCRWWVSSLDFENDIKVDIELFQIAGESYRKVRNTLRFLLSNLADFDPVASGGKGAVDLAALDPCSLDAWVLERTADLRERVFAAFRGYAFRQAHLQLFDFCNETLSAVYLDAVKDRLYCDRPDAPRRRSAQAAIRRIAETLIELLAPILPHTADEAWRALVGEDAGSVHLRVAEPVESAPADAAWKMVFEARERVLKALETAKAEGLDNRIDAGVVLGDPESVLAPFAAELPDVFGVSRVELTGEAGETRIVDLRAEPRCERSWRRDATVKQRADGGWLSDRDAEAVGLA